jgi:ATP-binding cassette subfamily F protein 3
MALVTVKDVEKAYQGRSVLKGISFELQVGQKIGLVGPNGAGKTTLLKILAGVEHADHGSVDIARSCKMSYVSQQPRLDPEETLRHQVALVFEELHEIERQMHEAADLLSKHPDGPAHDKAMERYGELEAHFQHMGGWDIERRVESVLDQLGFSQRDLDLPIKALSGGQKSRAQIGRLLLEGPDLMLLDEPTNHLDLPMLDWLEQTLNEMPDVTLVVVSHDRYFLDSVVTEVYDMEAGRVSMYPGNYSAFTDLKVERQAAQQHAFDQQQSYIAKQEEYIRRFSAGQRAMQARGRKTRLERLKNESLVGKVQRDGKRMVLNLKLQKTSGHEVLRVEDLTKGYVDKPLFADLEFTVSRGKRLGIIGPNGAGKTTLLNVLAGEATADAGTAKWGFGVTTQFYKQEHQDLKPDNNVLDELQTVRIDAKHQELRDLAGMFLFSGDTVEKKIAVLSGGEKSRVAMAKLLLKPTNTILMDEPTNHLDMATCEVLENALDTYDGTLILVSHDRYFMDQVCDELLVLRKPAEPGAKPTWQIYKGSYTDYLAAVAKEKLVAEETKKQDDKAQRKAQQEETERQKAQHAKAAQKVAKPKVAVDPKLAKLTIQELEGRIMEAEGELQSLDASFANPRVAANPQALRELKSTYDKKKQQLASLNAAWESRAAGA